MVAKYRLNLTSRNLIIFNNPASNQTVDVRGPYTVDSAVENEFTTIRMPTEALATLELNYGDSIYINGHKVYSINQTVPGEENIMRIPVAARSVMGLNVGDVITDGDIRNRFNDFYAVKALPVTGNISQLNLTEGVLLKSDMSNGRTDKHIYEQCRSFKYLGILKMELMKFMLMVFLTRP